MKTFLWFQNHSLRSLTQEFSNLMTQKKQSHILKAGSPQSFPPSPKNQYLGIWVIQGVESQKEIKSSLSLINPSHVIVVSLTNNNDISQLLISNGILEVFNNLDISLINDCFQKCQSSTAEETKKPRFSNLLFSNNSPMKKIAEFLYPLAQRPSNVFIQGESGVGKEVLAQSIHTNSKFSQENFVAINCGAINPQLIDSELFGHTKGSFTGADKDSIGKIRQAHNGTLFLDEIGELPLVAQTRLLRVLQERKVTPVGSTQEIPVNFRLICATHKNLENMVETGDFREDLYYRICVFKINIPNLNQRFMDIPIIAQHLWSSLLKSDQTLSQKLGSLNNHELSLLQNHTWKGNIRELKNTLEQFTLYKDLGQNLEQLLTPLIHKVERTESVLKNPADLETDYAEKEKMQILFTLEKTGWNKSKTARELGLSRNTLLRRLESYQV